MGIERTLIIIKPEHVDLADEILAELDFLGSRIATAKVDNVPLEVIEKHYAPHAGYEYYDWLIRQFVGKPIILAVYEGEDTMTKISGKIGHKDPARAPKTTIRGKYSKDSEYVARGEGRATANVVHKSSSMAEYEREIEIWRAYIWKT